MFILLRTPPSIICANWKWYFSALPAAGDKTPFTVWYLHYKIGGPTTADEKVWDVREHGRRVWLLADLVNSSNLLVAIQSLPPRSRKTVSRLFRTEYCTDGFPLCGFQQRVSRFLGSAERHHGPECFFQIFQRTPDRECPKHWATYKHLF